MQNLNFLYENYIYFREIFSDQVIQSDSELYFENDFIIHLKIVGTSLPESNESIHVSNKSIRYLSRECQVSFVKFMEIASNFSQLKYVKRGLLDFNYFLANNSDKDCLVLSILTGYVYNESSTIPGFINEIMKFNSTKHLKKHFLHEFDMENSVLFNGTLTDKIEHVAKILKRKICLFSAKNGLNGNYQLNYVSRNTAYYKPIKIVMMNNHAYFLFANRNIEFKKTEFCDYCYKSVSSIPLHKCILKKCPNCFLYKKNSKTINSDIKSFCYDEFNYEQDVRCQQCKKQFKNNQCFEIHKHLSKTLCMSSIFCEKCQRIHQDRKHVCNQSFCRKCYSSHEPTKFCAIKDRSRSKTYTSTYLLHLENASISSQFISLIKLPKFNSDQFTITTFFKGKSYSVQEVIKNEKIISNLVKQDLKIDFILSKILNSFCQCIVKCGCNNLVIVSDSSFSKLINMEEDIESFRIFHKENDIIKMESKKQSLTIVSSHEYFGLQEFEICFLLERNPYIFFLDSLLANLDSHQKIRNISKDYFLNKINFSNMDIHKLFDVYQPYLNILKQQNKQEILKERSLSVLTVLYLAYKKLNYVALSILGSNKKNDDFRNCDSMISIFHQNLVRKRLD